MSRRCAQEPVPRHVDPEAPRVARDPNRALTSETALHKARKDSARRQSDRHAVMLLAIAVVGVIVFFGAAAAYLLGRYG